MPTETPTPRAPYDHTLWLINSVESAINGMVSQGPVTAPTAGSIIQARSSLAIASALLAVADAARHRPEPSAPQPTSDNS